MNADPINPLPKNAAQIGLIACHCCGTVWHETLHEAHCEKCSCRLHARKPNSIQRTWALLITACIFYLPANLLPIMTTTTLLDSEPTTIMGGIIFFWTSGEWGLAVIVFLASFLVPLLKLFTLIILVSTVQYKSQWRRAQRAKLYRMIEIVGRWSMLDVFVVALLVGLVQIQGYAEITAGLGVVAFGLVVILTMLASMSFDPRLIWDNADHTETLALKG